MSEIVNVLKEVSILDCLPIGVFLSVCCVVCMRACVHAYVCACVRVCMCMHALCIILQCEHNGKLFLSQDSENGQRYAAPSAAVSQGAQDQKTRLARMSSSTDFTPERKAHVQASHSGEDKLLAADPTPANYKERFHLLINLEEKAHVEALKRYAAYT